jgi:hypothetical protein
MAVFVVSLVIGETMVEIWGLRFLEPEILEKLSNEKSSLFYFNTLIPSKYWCTLSLLWSFVQGQWRLATQHGAILSHQELVEKNDVLLSMGLGTACRLVLPGATMGYLDGCWFHGKPLWGWMIWGEP